MDYLSIYCYIKSYKKEKEFIAFAVNYGACASGSGTGTKRPFRIKNNKTN